jgi:hypothetical protein
MFEMDMPGCVVSTHAVQDHANVPAPGGLNDLQASRRVSLRVATNAWHNSCPPRVLSCMRLAG